MKDKAKLMLICFVMLYIILISLVSSANFVQNTPVDIKVQCLNNGTYCSSSGNCNLTILYPSNVLFINNTMTRQPVYYNLTLPNSSILGNYQCSFTCCDGGLCSTGDCGFTISPTGLDISTGQSFIYIFLIVMSFIVFLLLLYASIKIPFKNIRNNEGVMVAINQLKWLKVASIGLNYIVLMFIFGLSGALSRNFLAGLGIENFFNWGYFILLSLLIPFAILSIVLGFIVFITDKRLYKKIKRGGYFR